MPNIRVRHGLKARFTPALRLILAAVVYSVGGRKFTWLFVA